MTASSIELELHAGTILYDVDDGSIMLLYDRSWRTSMLYDVKYYHGHHGHPQNDQLVPGIWVWEILSSLSGHQTYSEQALISLIRAGIFVVLEDS
jgi:hypothetical protein